MSVSPSPDPSGAPPSNPFSYDSDLDTISFNDTIKVLKNSKGELVYYDVTTGQYLDAEQSSELTNKLNRNHTAIKPNETFSAGEQISKPYTYNPADHTLTMNDSITVTINANGTYSFFDNTTGLEMSSKAMSNLSRFLKDSHITLGDHDTFGGNNIIGKNTTIGSQNTIGGNTSIGTNVSIGNFNVIDGDNSIGSNVTINNNNVFGENSKYIGNDSSIGSNNTIGGNIYSNASIGNHTSVNNVGLSSNVGSYVNTNENDIGSGSSVGSDSYIQGGVGDNSKIGDNNYIVGTIGNNQSIGDSKMLYANVDNYVSMSFTTLAFTKPNSENANNTNF